jgi:hypothetical protein
MQVDGKEVFFDSFSSAYISYPVNAEEVDLFGWSLPGDIHKDSYVNLKDFYVLASQWQKCNDPEADDFDHNLFADPCSIPSNCQGVRQAGLVLEAETRTAKSIFMTLRSLCVII